MDHHVILTLGRSGSNTLRDMLNQSSEVLNVGEVLGEWTAIRRLQRRVPLLLRTDEAFLDWVLYSGLFLRSVNAGRSLNKTLSGNRSACKRVSGVRTFGFKDFSLNFLRYGLAGYLDARSDIKVIGLVRENVVDRMISTAMLGETGVVAINVGEGGTRAGLWIDPAQIAQLLTDIETENAELVAMLSRLPEERKFVIRYEELFSDHDHRQRIMDDTFRFLGVEPIQTEERMAKIVRTPLQDLIENLDDCLEAVSGTHHELLLREAVEA